MRAAVVLATILVVAGALLAVAGVTAAPLSRTCADGIDATGCEEAVIAVMKRGLPEVHPLILRAAVEPGSAPGPGDLGHRATVTFDLLGVPGPATIALYFDRGAHWGGESDRPDAEIAAWTFLPLIVAGALAALILGVAWRRRERATG